MAQAQRFLAQMLDALTYLHEKLSIIHMDIKPENICVTAKREFDLMDYILIDFGIAKQRTLGQAYKVVASNGGGTPVYMAPDIWDGRFGAGADIWSLGITAFELMRGKEGDPMTLLRRFPQAQAYGQGREVYSAMMLDFEYSDLAKSSKGDLYRKIVYKMMKPRPDERPTARECFAMLGCRGPLVTDNLLDPNQQKRARDRRDKERQEEERRKREKEDRERRDEERRRQERREPERQDEERRKRDRREKEDRERRDAERRKQERQDEERQKRDRDRREQERQDDERRKRERRLQQQENQDEEDRRERRPKKRDDEERRKPERRRDRRDDERRDEDKGVRQVGREEITYEKRDGKLVQIKRRVYAAD